MRLNSETDTLTRNQTLSVDLRQSQDYTFVLLLQKVMTEYFSAFRYLPNILPDVPIRIHLAHNSILDKSRQCVVLMPGT